jgi:hypothetical protein
MSQTASEFWMICPNMRYILETVALRHQLAVLARSDRRFRPGDRLLWLCLRRLWHRWKEALVLVEPATVSRWHRQGFARCWRLRSRRRPGRPRIDSKVQLLIRRMATSNWLWGAPRIHGELLKLGISVSERTVSRYMPDRMKAPSQSWCTFIGNQFGQLAFASAVMSSDAPGVHDVTDARVCGFAPSLHWTGGRSHCRVVGICRLASLASTPACWRAFWPGSRAPPHNLRATGKDRRSRAPSAFGRTRPDEVPSLETRSRTTNSRGGLRQLDPRTPSLSAVPAQSRRQHRVVPKCLRPADEARVRQSFSGGRNIGDAHA